MAAALCAALLLGGCADAPLRDTAVQPAELFTEERLALTADYARRHYGIDGYELR